MVESDDEITIHPRQTLDFVGHEAVEKTLAAAANGDRLHHAWLFAGSKGIGKATLAFRFARYLLSENFSKRDQGPSLFGDDFASDAEDAGDLSIDPADPVIAKVAAESHPDLMVVERIVDPDKGTLNRDINVAQIRKLQKFFTKTAAEGGWRIAIVDCADDMNRNAANALLKVLEEPPKKSLLMLISHAPGGLLPTIRSRCQVLSMKELAEESVHRVLLQRYPELDNSLAQNAANLTGGAPGAAIKFIEQDGVSLYGKILALCEHLPHVPTKALHAFATALGAKKNEKDFFIFVDLMSLFFQRAAFRRIGHNTPVFFSASEETAISLLSNRLHPSTIVDLWQDFKDKNQQAEGLNLDRKQFIINFFEEMKRVFAN